jgi:putative two-component system response regulator
MNPVILLVDAASEARDNWKAFLRNQNFDVFTAEDGDAALKGCRLLQPDLVLLHDGLPDVDTLELCRQLKGDPLNQLIPVVLVKPSPDFSDVTRGREASAVDCWGTPTSLWDALSRVQSLLRLKSYIDEQAKSVLLSLERSIETKESLKAGHSERVAAYAEQLGEACGLAEEDLRDLQIASSLHDIGKVAVPDSILLKPGPLDAEETHVMRQHPVIGERICAPLKALRRILPVIRHHHEHMDGTGYPDGLRGDEIPLKARILQIADIYDALVTDRPYRDALSSEEALSILHREAMYGWLDASLVSKFSRICRSSQFLPVIGRSMLASYYA